MALNSFAFMRSYDDGRYYLLTTEQTAQLLEVVTQAVEMEESAVARCDPEWVQAIRAHGEVLYAAWFVGGVRPLDQVIAEASMRIGNESAFPTDAEFVTLMGTLPEDVVSWVGRDFFETAQDLDEALEVVRSGACRSLGPAMATPAADELPPLNPEPPPITITRIEDDPPLPETFTVAPTGGLSTGAKIAIGATVTVVLLGGLGLWLTRKG